MATVPRHSVVALFSVLCAAMFVTPVGESNAAAETLWFYCGTYTTTRDDLPEEARGIGIYNLDTNNGEIVRVGSFADISKSSHLCLSADQQFLYSVSEINDYQGKPTGSVTVFSIDPKTKMLSRIQTVSSEGRGPAYVNIDHAGKYLLLANYGAGNAVVYPIQPDGTLGKPSAKIVHTGSSVNPARQQEPHPHSIMPSPDNRFFYVPDLGIDRIVAYELSAGTANPRSEFDVITPPGSGPRHFVFSPSGRWAFASLELTSEVAAYSYENGKLTEVDRQSTLPADFSETNTCAEVRVSPNGKHVYVSNRGDDSIAVFSVDLGTGKLERVHIISTEGTTPRNFGISSDGKWVVAANQRSHSLVSYRRDSDTGKLRYTGSQVSCQSPVLICFVATE